MKRFFDLIFSSLGLLIFSPLFLLVAILIKLDSKGPVFFRQKRVGKNGKIFKIYKFRTMVKGAQGKGGLITTSEEDPRITPFGRLLRKYKADELPQLINVLRGEMSLVGPRPEVLKYVALYTLEQKRVLSVRPGITDSASLKYVDENKILSKTDNWEKIYVNHIMPDKLAINIEYIKKRSSVLDLVIILKTICKIFRK